MKMEKNINPHKALQYYNLQGELVTFSSEKLASVNTEEFRSEAKHFMKYGRYCDDNPGTIGYEEYWDEQERRCLNGYKVGGVYITGEHYFYLNFCQIKMTNDEDEIKGVIKILRTQKRKKEINFPSFWDSDFEFFHMKKVAERLGKHMVVGKARRKGYSYKNGALCAYNYEFLPNSLSLIGAFDKKYLYPKGTMKMAYDYVNFCNEFTDWSKRTLIDKQEHIMSGFYEDMNGIDIEKGFKSQILAISFGNNPDAARGSDADLILFEEAGKFPNLMDAFISTRATTEDGSYVTGQMIVFGTGGGDEGNWEAFEELFYDPDSHNCLAFDNKWDEGLSGSKCSFFVPDFKNKKGFIDANGCSLEEDAIAYEEAKRKQLSDTAKNPTIITKYKMEQPFSPREAFSRSAFNLFPIEELELHRSRIIATGLANIGIAGKLTYGETLKFKPDASIVPIMKFPYKENDTVGGIVIFEQPRRVDGVIPKDLYIVCNDPYAHDSGQSLGATYVMMNPNKYFAPGDKIVACYIGRPENQDAYNENLFALASFYNAKIGFENDRGDVIGFAKRFRRLHQLEGEFELAYDDRMNNKLGRSYGMSMGGGKENLKKIQGDIYIRDWLNEVRGIDANGNIIKNLHAIFDVGLLDELIKYKPGGNYDRVSALRIGMYFKRELMYTNRNPEKNSRKVKKNSIFGRSLYQ